MLEGASATYLAGPYKDKIPDGRESEFPAVNPEIQTRAAGMIEDDRFAEAGAPRIQEYVAATSVRDLGCIALVE